jgi:ribonuclease R
MARPHKPKSSYFAGKAPAPGKQPQGLPDRETLLEFLRTSGEAAKGDIARAFGLKGADRKALRTMLTDLEAEGALGRRGRRGFAEAGALPEVGVADVIERNTDGELMVRLTKGEETPLIPLAPQKGADAGPAPGVGDRLLVRFERLETGETEARLIKAMGQSAHKHAGRHPQGPIARSASSRSTARPRARCCSPTRRARPARRGPGAGPGRLHRGTLRPQARQGAGGRRP